MKVVGPTLFQLSYLDKCINNKHFLTQHDLFRCFGPHFCCNENGVLVVILIQTNDVNHSTLHT